MQLQKQDYIVNQINSKEFTFEKMEFYQLIVTNKQKTSYE